MAGGYTRWFSAGERRPAGRLMVMRDMGKSCFAKIQDQTGMIQLYVRKDVLGENGSAFNFHVFQGDLSPVEKILQQALCLPMLGGKTTCEILSILIGEPQLGEEIVRKTAQGVAE